MASQAIKSYSPVRPLSLFGVLLVARLLTLSGSPLPASVWTIIAYLWQDAAVALAFGLVDYLMRGHWLGWVLYGLAVVYVAINVAVVRVLSSPLTLPMIRAARGPLADSITYYLTGTNLVAIAVAGCAGVVLPIVFARWRPRSRRGALATAAVSLAFVAFGPLSISKVDTAGRYRNAFGALWPAHIRVSSGREAEGNWRTSPFPAGSRTNNELARFRGGAAGRNVIMVLLESTAARYWPVSPGAIDPMPNLTALAGQSIFFEHAYAVYPESIKGLLSVLCSDYPAFDTPAEIYSGIACPALPQQLRKAGYRTALFHSGRFMYLGMPAIIENRGFEVMEDAGTIGGNVHSSFGVDDGSTVRRILSWLDSLKPGERFFVTYLPVAGHHPYVTPHAGPFAVSAGGAGGNEDLTRYLNALHYGDEAFGELVDGLRTRNLDQNTLFIVFGDHGEAFGQHEGDFGHTLFIYDENVHVPYVIAAPGLIRDRLRADEGISLLDTAPTVLDLLGLPIPGGYQGASMLDSRPRMSLFFTDYSLGWLGLYDSCRKYLLEINSGHQKLYDVCADPGETNDLSIREAWRGPAYRSRLQDWISARHDAVLIR